MALKVVIYILFVTFSVIYGGKKYNTETYYVGGKGSREIIRTPSSEYYVLNVGKPTVTVQIIWASLLHNSYGLILPIWKGPLAECVLKHGENYTFQFSRKKKIMVLKVINNEEINGFVHAFSTEEGFPEFDDADYNYFEIDKNDLLKTIVGTGVAYVPIVGEVLDGLVDFFWPDTEENVFEQIEEQLKKLVDSRIKEAVDGILEGSIEQFRARIQMVYHEINNPNITKTSRHYINIAEDLIGFERNFIFKGENSVSTNFFLLPLYAASINLKITYYQYGIKNRKKIGIDKDEVDRLTYYLFEAIHNSKSGAVAHVHKTCEDKLLLEYKSSYAENIFDQLASIREYCALNGLEHVSLWKSIAANPNITSIPDISVVVYSTQFGRNTAQQSAEMVKPTHPSLTPKLIKGKLNIPTKVTVFLTSNNRIGGMKITSADGTVVVVGPTTDGNNKVIDFQGKRLVKLIVRGNGQIDGLTFIFEDGTIIDTGTQTRHLRQFELDKHHIVGFYMTNSLTRISPDIAANIAVSYQLMHDKINGTTLIKRR